MTLSMSSSLRSGYIKGECANCHKDVYAPRAILDDGYAVFRGVCPHCDAVNLLDCGSTTGRGYNSSHMFLCLPNEHECRMNNWDDVLFKSKCTCDECAAIAKAQGGES